MKGYGQLGYVASLSEFGTPRALSHSGSWILQRSIPGFPCDDAMGGYPLFACQNWAQLQADLEDIDDLVSLAIVPDPFGEYDLANLRQCFPDVMMPFKEHFVIDLHCPIDQIADRKLRKNARRALRQVEVEVVLDPIRYLNEWVGLYDNLIARHQIRGIRAFSYEAFAAQLRLPGVVMLRATQGGEVVGAQLYMVQGEAVHCHLGAYSEKGYDLGITTGLDWVSIEYFAGKVRWIDLGGGAGVTANSDSDDGLTLYKRRWATETRTVYFCGRILDRAAYTEITAHKGLTGTSYFPAYRKGEFA